MQLLGALLIVLASVLMWSSKVSSHWSKKHLHDANCKHDTSHRWPKDILAKSKRHGRMATSTLWVSFGVLCAVGVIDLILVGTGQQTISQYIRTLFPTWLDIALMCYLVFQTWMIFKIRGLIPMALGCIYGHLFW
jgi:hypothetical protein